MTWRGELGSLKTSTASHLFFGQSMAACLAPAHEGMAHSCRCAHRSPRLHARTWKRWHRSKSPRFCPTCRRKRSQEGSGGDLRTARCSSRQSGGSGGAAPERVGWGLGGVQVVREQRRQRSTPRARGANSAGPGLLRSACPCRSSQIQCSRCAWQDPPSGAGRQ